MSPDKDGRFKGISVPKAIPSEEPPETVESTGDHGDGGTRTRANSQEKCSFCHGKPVANGWGWHEGRILAPLPCPRCGETNDWPNDWEHHDSCS